jgi:hypothetical protein
MASKSLRRNPKPASADLADLDHTDCAFCSPAFEAIAHYGRPLTCPPDPVKQSP